MDHRIRETRQGSADYHFYLAQNLLRSLGYDGALDACRDKGWMGTLDIIRRKAAPGQCH